MRTAFLVAHAVGFVVLGAAYATTLPRDAPYLDSPLWVGLPRELARAIAVAQIAALAGWIAWIALVAVDDQPSALLTGASAAFYLASALWPWHARRLVARPTYARALLACAPLWVAAASVGTLAHATSPVLARLALAPAAAVVIGCDAVVWSAGAIFLVYSTTRS